MYHYISNLTPAGQEFMNYLSSGKRTRERLTSLVLGRAIAETLQIPGGLVESVTQHYKVSSLITATSIVSGINELAVIDTDSVLEFVEKFFTYRYSVYHRTVPIVALVPDTAVEDFFGVSIFISKEDIALLKANPIEATKLYGLAVRFLADVNNPDKEVQ